LGVEGSVEGWAMAVGKGRLERATNRRLSREERALIGDHRPRHAIRSARAWCGP
jgi:hypothetical protein